MASIRKKNQKWQVQIRRKGQPAISKTFLRKADAHEWARLMEAKADRGDIPISPKILNALTLGDLVRRYRDEIAVRKKCASVEVTILNAFLRHGICKKSLAAIGAVDWVKYRDERLISITAKSLKRELSPISHMYSVAIKEWELPLAINPIARLNIRQKDVRRERRLQGEEEKILLSECAKIRAKYLFPMVCIAIQTGMRRGEILKIKVEHIDFKRSLLSIPETKNGEARIIPLTAKALEILRERSGKLTAGPIFSVSPNALRLAWERTCKRANIANLHFHDLRHEAISRFFEIGLTTPEVALISGHKDVRMLFRYAHASQNAIHRKFRQSQTWDISADS